MNGLRAGHPEAQSELFRRHRASVMGVLRRAFGNDPDVPDLLQEVFYHALRGAKHYRGDRQGLELWLRRIALFTARGLMRRRAVRKRYAAPSSVDVTEQATAEVASPEQVEALKRVYEIFDMLPDGERLPFTLSLATDMSRDELARACGLSPSTLKRRLIRARTRFDKLVRRDPVLLSRLAD